MSSELRGSRPRVDHQIGQIEVDASCGLVGTFRVRCGRRSRFAWSWAMRCSATPVPRCRSCRGGCDTPVSDFPIARAGVKGSEFSQWVQALVESAPSKYAVRSHGNTILGVTRYSQLESELDLYSGFNPYSLLMASYGRHGQHHAPRISHTARPAMRRPAAIMTHADDDGRRVQRRSLG